MGHGGGGGDGKTELMDAAERGDADEVRRILEVGLGHRLSGLWVQLYSMVHGKCAFLKNEQLLKY